MAYQPKSYRKFVATAATATLVAGAVAPFASAAADASKFTDVTEKYQEAVKFVVSKGAQGTSETTFGVSDNIKRGDAAVLLVQVLGLDTASAPDAGFKDVNSIKKPYINALKAAGITSGKTETTFAPDAKITRGELAIWIAKGFGLKGTGKVDFNDVNKNYVDAVSALVENKVTSGTSETTFGTTANAKRGDYAKFLLAADKAKTPVVAKVETVTVSGEKTLKLAGTGLQNLKAESITLAGNEVASVNAAADGKTADVTFKQNFPLDKEQTVKIEQEGTKEFKFTYSLAEIKTVELDAKTFDDDTKGQVLTFKVNGLSTTADADFLRQAGYSVKFVAVDKDGKAATTFFAGPSSESTTGLLADKLTIGNYTVEVQLVKAGKVVLSDKKVVSVADLESASRAIKSVELKDDTTNLVKNSTTLVAGESVTVSDIVGDAANKTDVSLPVGLAQITSSNSSVLSVAGNKLKANGPGTAVVTVKIGSATKDITITVTNKERVLDKVTSSEASVKVVKGQARVAKITVLDQYGDVIPAAQLTNDKEVTVDAPQNSASAKLVTVPGTLSATTLSITGAEVGTGTILFKDPNGKVIGQIAAQVTDVDNVASYKVEYAATSTIVKDSFGVGKSAVYQYSKFNNSGFYNGATTVIATGNATAGQFKVESANQKVATVTASGTEFTVTGVLPGSTDITIKNDAGQIVDKFTVTITADPIVITKVNFKATSTIDYIGKKVNVADVLDVRADGSNNPIVYGIEHNANTIEKVRLSDTSANNLTIYIDNGATAGSLDSTDTVLGYVQAEVLSGSTSAITVTDITVDGTNYTTASKDKGQILFRVLEDDKKVTSTIASTTLSVDVK